YRLLVHGETLAPRPYRLDVYSRNVERDAQWFLQNWRASRSDPLLITVPRARALGDARHLLAGREHWDALALDDWRPGGAELPRTVGGLVGRGGVRLACRLHADPAPPAV